MKTAGWLAGAALAAALGVGGWFGYHALTHKDGATAEDAAVSQILPDRPGGGSGIESVDASQANLPGGGTPMAERVAVVGLLNKRNGVSRELTLKPGQAIRVGDAVVRLRACEKTASWEPEQLTGAFVQLDVRGANQRWQRVFSGWLYKERPALNVVQHPVYDVWAKSCTMSWPETGPETVPAASSGAAPRRSSAAKSPAADTPADEAPGATTPANASDSSAT
ncbi:hypothetical protein QE360_000354 [Sphingomonas sp. SORGH_AS789]|nr:hypothetical protein [Sphingomonas sp. SORGH_AS_0789]MDR6149254.1 hypothetical protein [Sphingomonas sp. SORGH_AS_0742]